LLSQQGTLEFYAVFAAAKESIWLKSLLLELGIDVGRVPIKCDSKCAIALVKGTTLTLVPDTSNSPTSTRVSSKKWGIFSSLISRERNNQRICSQRPYRKKVLLFIANKLVYVILKKKSLSSLFPQAITI